MRLFIAINIYVFTANSETKFHSILVFLILISYEKVLEVKFNKKSIKHCKIHFGQYILTRESTLFSDFCITSIAGLFAYVVLGFSDFPHIKSLKDYLLRKMPWSNIIVLLKKAFKTKFLKDF